jgi:uncharacterized protein YkwD
MVFKCISHHNGAHAIVDRETIGGRLLRYLGAVVAVLAVLIAAGVVATGHQRSASASEEPYVSEEVQFLQLLNQYRRDNGVEPLLLSDAISVAAEHHSQDMAEYGFFAHTTAASSHYPVGSQPWDRMRAEGYDYNTLMGENIAVGCESAERCFELWRTSPSHNAAMLDGNYRVIGVARLNIAGSVHGWYWTTDFGATVDPSSHAPGESSQEEREKPLEDGGGIENGGMSSKAVWEQEAIDHAELILPEVGYARLGDYDNGRDKLWQKIRVPENSELSYRIKIETNEQQLVAGNPSDYLKVRLMDGQGEQLAVLEKYTDADAGGGWRRETVDLSRFAGRTVYLSFFVETDPLLTTAFYLDRVALEDKEQSSS